jgi:DNA-binding transcriptional MerR regulator
MTAAKPGPSATPAAPDVPVAGGPVAGGPVASGPVEAAAGPSPGPLLGISDAAAAAGVSERALRYYQQLGLITPQATRGGFRRYSADDLARVARIRELQAVLGLNLDEIAEVLDSDDRIAAIRVSFRDKRTGARERAALLRESIEINERLRAVVDAKRAELDRFITDLDERIERSRRLMNEQGATARR